MANEGLQNIQALGQAAASFQGIMQEISAKRIQSIQLKAQADFNDSARAFEQKFYSGEINSGNYQDKLSDFMAQQSEYVSGIDYEPAKKFVSEYISGQKRSINTLVASKLGAQELKKAEADLQSVYDRLPDGKSKIQFAKDNRSVWSPESYSVNISNAESQARVESLADEARRNRTNAEAIKWLSDPRNVTDKMMGEWGEVKPNEVTNAISMISAQYKNDVAVFVEENIAPKVKSFEEKGFNAELYDKSVLAIESSMMDQSDKDRMLSQMTKYRNDSVYDGYRNRIVGTIKETANGGVGYDPKLLLEEINKLQEDNGDWFKTPEGSEEKKKLIEFANGYMSGSAKSDTSARELSIWTFINDSLARGIPKATVYKEVFDNPKSPYYNSVRDMDNPLSVSFLEDMKKKIDFSPATPIQAPQVSDTTQNEMARSSVISAMYPGKLWKDIGADGQARVELAESAVKTIVRQTLGVRGAMNEKELSDIYIKAASPYKEQIDIFNYKPENWKSDDGKFLMERLSEFSGAYDKQGKEAFPVSDKGERILPPQAEILSDPNKPETSRINQLLSFAVDKIASRIGVDKKTIHLMTNKQEAGYGDLPAGEPLFIDTVNNKVYRLDQTIDTGLIKGVFDKKDVVIMEADLSTMRASTNLSWNVWKKKEVGSVLGIPGVNRINVSEQETVNK